MRCRLNWFYPIVTSSTRVAEVTRNAHYKSHLYDTRPRLQAASPIVALSIPTPKTSTGTPAFPHGLVHMILNLAVTIAFTVGSRRIRKPFQCSRGYSTVISPISDQSVASMV